MSKKVFPFGLILTALILSLLSPSVMAGPNAPLAGWNGHVWTDTFSDSTSILSLGNATQVTVQAPGGFTPRPGNPLSTIESIDPWDSNGDPRYQIPGAVHPDVQYFPDGIDGYKFWMIFTPLAFTPLPPGIPDPPIPSMKPDWWWERPTLVRSNDGINWVKTTGYTNPLVSAGAAGEWDSGWLADPDFVYAPGKGPHGESWFLYYTGCSSGCAIALAMSQDGLHYTKYDGDLNPDTDSTPVAPAYRCPAVIYDPSGNGGAGLFRMWYDWSGTSIGYATSLDGINWTPNGGNWSTNVYQGHPGTYDQGGVTHEDVVYYGGMYHMYYMAMPTAAYAGINIGHATSPDGIAWTQDPNPAMVPGGESWTFWNTTTPAPVQSFYRPSVAPVGNMLYMYYGGTDTYVAYPTIHYDLGLAFPSVPSGHVQLTKTTFQPAEYSTRANTLAWYHMNEGNPPPTTYPGEYTSLDSTLAWYHFNEGSGPTTADIGGPVPDTGTINGATQTPALYGNGLLFDGNDQVTAADSTDLNPTNGVTVEAWVNPSRSKSNNYVAIKMTPGSTDYAYGLKVDSGQIGGFIRNGSTLYFSYGGQVPINTWSHIAMTYQFSPTQTNIRLYLNGVEVSSYSTQNSIPANTTISNSTGLLNIGLIPVSSPTFYEGVIDELRVVGRALTPAEIAADGTLVATQNVVLDSSGNNNHGTPNMGVNWTTGQFSYGLNFNGTSGVVNVPHSTTLNPQTAITIEAWVNPSVTKTNNYILSKASTGIADFAYGFKLENTYTGSSEIAGIIGAVGSTPLYFAYGGSVPNNTWTHVAMTYQVGDSHIRLYKNGVEVAYRYGTAGAATDTIPANTQIKTNTAPVNIGLLPMSPGLYYQGILDELRILDRALTPGEIMVDYGSSYFSHGYVESVLITTPTGDEWALFSAVDNRPAGTNITYSILNDAGDVLLSNVTSGTNISSLGNQTIRLRADLYTTDPGSTPFVHSWTLTSNAPTAVTLSSFTGASHLSTVRLDWATANEVGLVGFNVWRSESLDGPRQKQNASLLPASNAGQMIGAAYQFSDVVSPGKRYYYWLELVQIDGNVLSAPLMQATDYLVLLPVIVR